MAQKTVKTFSIPTSATYSVMKSSLSGGLYTKKQNQYMSPVRKINVNSSTGEEIENKIFFWNLSSAVTQLIELDIDPDSLVVQKVEIEFYTRNAETPYQIDNIEFAPYTLNPSALSSTNAYNESIARARYTREQFYGNEKKYNKITIGDEANTTACTDVLASIVGNTFFAITLRRDVNETTDGYIEISGQTMICGTENPWRAASGNEVTFAPKLIITYAKSPSSFVNHEMRYTISTPNSSQSTPSSSLGGYFSSNKVFTVAQIGSNINNSQTSIKISSDAESSLPSSTGLAQVGPEIFTYTAIDSANRLLTGVTRGTVPKNGSFPATIEESADLIRYLDTDKLFERKPTEGLVQYRCVAIMNTSIFTAESVQIFAIQNSESDVQIDIGIEVPKFDTKIVTTSAAITSGNTTFRSSSADVIGYDDNFFNNAYIVLDPDTTAFSAIITAYTHNGSYATFTTDRSLPSLSNGITFIVYSAPSQTIANEITEPTSNSGRFFGFMTANEASSSITFNNIRENKGSMYEKDIIYLWIKRTLKQNVYTKPDTGCIIFLKFVDQSIPT